MITDWLDPVSYKLGIAAGGGGGSNPNYAETITGTLANPWGGVDTAALLTEIQSNNATCMMTIDATALDIGIFPVIALPFAVSQGFIFELIGTSGPALNNWGCTSVNYHSDGTFYTFYALTGGNVIDPGSYASTIPTTLTIIHHPLP